MYAVVEIDVRRTWSIALDKAARARARKRVCRFVVCCRIRFHLDNDPGAFAPNQFSADEFARTRKRIALEERRPHNPVHQPTVILFTRIERTQPMACSKRESSPYIQPACRCGRRG